MPSLSRCSKGEEETGEVNRQGAIEKFCIYDYCCTVDGCRAIIKDFKVGLPATAGQALCGTCAIAATHVIAE